MGVNFGNALIVLKGIAIDAINDIRWSYFGGSLLRFIFLEVVCFVEILFFSSENQLFYWCASYSKSSPNSN